MKIDKSRFLLLTTTLAASAAAALVSTSGCTVTSTNNTNTTADASTSTLDSGTSSSSGGSNDGGGTTDSGYDGGQTSCAGDVGTLPYCAPTGEGAYVDAGPEARCVEACQSHNDWFKPGVAAGIKACLDVAPTTEGALCADRAPTCADTWIAKACADTTAAAWCATFLTCPTGGAYETGDAGPTSVADCLKIAPALSSLGRQTLKACVDQQAALGGPCGEGVLADCYEGLKIGASQ